MMQAVYKTARDFFALEKMSDVFYFGFLSLVGIVLLFCIFFVKSQAVIQFEHSPILLAYTILITTFELSRLAGAIFYQRINRAISRPSTRLYEPTVTFVIPCKNEGEAIENTITKCFQADYPKEKLEVIIINDGSTDNTIDVIRMMQRRYPELIVVDWKQNRGKRHGMAEGFRRAQGEIVVQLDSDSFIKPDTFREMIKPFRHPEIGAVCAHADPANADTNIITRMQAAYYFMSFRILKAAESTFLTVFCCSGCSSAYRKSAVLPILDKWLNERFWGKVVTWGDDRSLTSWVLRAGLKTMYTHKAQAYTICPDSFRTLVKQQVRWKKSWIINSYFTSRFIYKKQPFVAFTYFFPLILVTLATPIMAIKALIINPLYYSILPFYYLFGTFLLASLFTIYYRGLSRENKFWPYVFAWSILNTFFLSFILVYAALTLQNRKWGTR